MTGVVGKFGGAGKWMSRNLYAILYGAITKPNNWQKIKGFSTAPDGNTRFNTFNAINPDIHSFQSLFDFFQEFEYTYQNLWPDAPQFCALYVLNLLFNRLKFLEKLKINTKKGGDGLFKKKKRSDFQIQEFSDTSEEKLPLVNHFKQ